MQPRVTAILVARNGADFLERTLASLESQTRRPDALVFVDAGSTDATSEILAAAGPTQFVATSSPRAYGAGVAQGVHVASPAESSDDWLWLLSHDSAPHPRALAMLLAAVEVAPSVAIAGPKVMRWDRADTIAEYGETLTRFGASVALVENELDQAQHDQLSDLLGVAATGMLVRRSAWHELGGFDPGLPSVDAALDFSVRARLAGHRVVGVPAAKVSSAGGPALFGRSSVPPRVGWRLRRSAQLHRRLVYSRRAALPLHWLSLVPLAIIRALIALVRKRPSAMLGELSSAFRAAFGGAVGPARRTLRRTKKVGWASIAPLRMSVDTARQHRAQQVETAASRAGLTLAPSGAELTTHTRASFFGGGAWIVLLAAVVGIITFSPLLGSPAVAGGALLPLSESIGVLWSHVGYGWHEVGGGFVGPSDPFTALLAVLGSFTFWSPSTSIVVLYLIALPVSALGAWWCAVRLTSKSWPPAIAALLWALAPPLLSSMTNGHLGAVIAHMLLPWLVVATLTAVRSWSAAAGAALLFAAVAASAPILVPALLVAFIAWMAARPTRIHRLIGILIPAAVLFAPLVYAQVSRGNWLSLFVEPGSAARTDTAVGWHLALGSPLAGLGGWDSGIFGMPPAAGSITAAALLAPFAVLALTALFVRRARRAIPALVLALLGFVTAVIGTHLQLTIVGAETSAVWAGAALSLYWLGLTGAVVVALDALGKAVVAPALVLALASTLAVAPLLGATLAGTADVHSSTGRLLPAFVAAETANRPGLGTLELAPQPDGSVALTLHRGEGTSLDDLSTFASTTTRISAQNRALAVLAGNLASRTGLDVADALNSEHVGFVLLKDAAAGKGADTRQRIADALDGNRVLTPIGRSDLGSLWNFENAASGSPQATPTTTGTPIGITILVVQGLVFLVTLLLAVPASRGRGRSTVRSTAAEESTMNFEEDDSV